MSARLTEIRVFPVKSTAGRPLDSVEVEPLGLTGDRRWMIVDPDGECVTARTDADLLTIVAGTSGEDLTLRTGADGADTITVAPPTGPVVEVTVHGRPLHGIPAGPEVGDWLAQVTGRRDLRLVHLGRPRPLNPDFSKPGDATAFADAYPVTLASMASLRRVQDWVTETALERGEDPTEISIDRFRPNLVIEGELEPFEEEGWQSVCVGEVVFDVAKLIDRCVLTTIEPTTRQRGHEPIRSLARHHAWDGKTWFGLQLIPRSHGPVRVGDRVTGT